ncbi:MAG: putative phosphotransferase [Candidatus Scalindua rubra]|uniref:Transcription antitermination protein NusB n=1 Tax=Candidatus Scalindua rubra TaxID=1872076 RepID=A0A1E3XDY9_9BACT|nr:MAG: putative phosphotransferase [Candidatus Scalindua rubra]
MRKRTHSREIALQALYQLEIRGDEVINEIDSFCNKQCKESDVSNFAIKLVKGCIQEKNEIDKKIISTSENWDLHRMPVIDRNILRLACYELLYMNDIPPKVSINEAIDLAKKYSTEKSGLFVNGVLDKVYSLYVKTNEEVKKITTSIENRVKLENEKRTGADLHIHTVCSDGTMSPEQVVEEASKLNLRTIAIADHDSVDAVEIAQTICNKRGINIIPAVELSSYYCPADIHILGYFIDIKNSALLGKLSELRFERIERIKKITKKLRSMGVNVEHQEVFDVAEEGSPGRLHVADVLCRKGYCNNIQESFQKYLSDNGPAYVPKVTLTLRDAIELIISSGGIPVFSHPGVTKKDALIPKMVEYGLQGIEVYYPTHLPEVRKRYIQLAKEYDLVITGGSDCHGERKPDIKLGSITIDDGLVDKIRERHDNAVGVLSCGSNV